MESSKVNEEINGGGGAFAHTENYQCWYKDREREREREGGGEEGGGGENNRFSTPSQQDRQRHTQRQGRGACIYASIKYTVSHVTDNDGHFKWRESSDSSSLR